MSNEIKFDCKSCNRKDIASVSVSENCDKNKSSCSDHNININLNLCESCAISLINKISLETNKKTDENCSCEEEQ